MLCGVCIYGVLYCNVCVLCLYLLSVLLPLVTSSEVVTAIITMETTVDRVTLGTLQEVCVPVWVPVWVGVGVGVPVCVCVA